MNPSKGETMKVRDLIEQLHDLHGDAEVEICNKASGYKSIKVSAIGVEAGAEKIVLIGKEFDYMAQIKLKYRTFAFTGATRDGDFVDATASGFIPDSAVSAIKNAVQKSDKKEFRKNEV